MPPRSFTLHFLRVSVDDILLQMETFVANLDDTGTACYMVVALNLRYKLCLYLYHYDGQSLPIDTLADGSDIVCLCRIVELKIDRIVHMPELVNVVETKNHRDRFLIPRTIY